MAAGHVAGDGEADARTIDAAVKARPGTVVSAELDDDKNDHDRNGSDDD
ncbi:hypothetical protein ACWGQ4_23095 [Streptomyces sp. NPDC055721]